MSEGGTPEQPKEPPKEPKIPPGGADSPDTRPLPSPEKSTWLPLEEAVDLDPTSDPSTQN